MEGIKNECDDLLYDRESGTTSFKQKMEFQTENWVPHLKMEFQTEEQAWVFWLNYSGKMGFKARKSYSHKSRIDGSVTSVVFVCSSEGKREKKVEQENQSKRAYQIKYPRRETRTGCQVRLQVKFNRGTNRFEVVDFVSEHNHPLQRFEVCHLAPSQREVPEIACCGIDLADDFGIRPKEAHELMSRQVGPTNLSYTVRDQSNYLRDKHRRALISGEVLGILNYFHERVLENPSFQHFEQVNEGLEVTNIFWVDAKMVADYARFGDVIVFDTTFGTNKECWPFGIFGGFNHFREIVIFGAVLLYDQSADSFEWVFKIFLEAHYHKKPRTIFTDQEIALEIAITNVMPETTHGLCTWHVMDNCRRHLSCYSKNGVNILEDFSACMYEYEEEAKFEKAFSDLEKRVSEQTCLPFIYKYKEKWAYCYMKNAMSLGMRSAQLSESIHRELKSYLKSDMDIIQLLKHFERVVKGKRDKEIKLEYEWRRKKPNIKITVPILEQASSLYTTKIFELFQNEFELSMSALVEGPLDNEYTVKMCDFDNLNLSHKCQKVLWNQDSLTVLCRCKKFERIGILCWHALKVLDWMNIKVLPEKYILARWTQEARKGDVEDRNRRIVIEDTRLDMVSRNRDLCHKFTKIAAKAACAEELSVFTDGVLDKLDKQLEEKKQKFINIGYIR